MEIKLYFSCKGEYNDFIENNKIKSYLKDNVELFCYVENKFIGKFVLNNEKWIEQNKEVEKYIELGEKTFSDCNSLNDFGMNLLCDFGDLYKEYDLKEYDLDDSYHGYPINWISKDDDPMESELEFDFEKNEDVEIFMDFAFFYYAYFYKNGDIVLSDSEVGCDFPVKNINWKNNTFKEIFDAMHNEFCKNIAPHLPD